MIQKKCFTPLLTAILIITIGFCPLFSQNPVSQQREKPHDNDNIYLGTLADGYPHTLIVNEFKAANAKIIGMRDKIIVFSVSPNTKATTFFRNLPFLTEIHLDGKTIGQNDVLKRHPLAAKFTAMHQKRTQGVNAADNHSNHLKNQPKSSSPQLTEVDRLIHAKAAKLQKAKAVK